MIVNSIVLSLMILTIIIALIPYDIPFPYKVKDEETNYLLYLHIFVLFLYSILNYLCMLASKYFPNDYRHHFSYSGINTDGEDLVRIFIKSIFFTTTTHSTVGYGDVYPDGSIARFLVFTHLLISNTLSLGLITSALNKNI